MEAIRQDYHPLEIIPIFRRIPCSFGRDFAYTFIWNGLFALAFFGINAVAAGKLPPLLAFQLRLRAPLQADVTGAERL